MRALPALLLLVLSACSSGGAPGAAEDACPPSLRGAEVPASTAETGGRLVPREPPVSAVVCRYGPVRSATDEQATSRLVGERELAAGLEELAADLQLAPAPNEGYGMLCAVGQGGVTPYVLRLAYETGTVSVLSHEDPNGCSRLRTSTFDRREGIGDVLAASYAAGRWTVPVRTTAPDLEGSPDRCVPERTGRAAGAGALLPDGASRVVLCRRADGETRRHAATATEQDVVADVLSDPVAVPSTGACDSDGGRPSYEVAATYPSGPALLLTYVPGCTPEVDNGSLSAQLEPDGRRRLDALLRTAFGN